jgi:phage shock protein E
MGIFSTLFGGTKTNEKVSDLLQRGALIIDVRTPEEYKAGHIKESVNIPLNNIPNKVNELKRKNKPIITCCRSGARSGMAADQLRRAGIEVENGGPWNSVQAMM